jgi:spermidine/putrescine transport system permease protein
MELTSEQAASPRSGWARLAANPLYRAVSDALTSTKRRRFWFLASLPLVWILFANLGPMIQMLRISALSSYPPIAGREPHWTLDNWLLFFENPNYMTPFTRTFIFAFSFTAITLLITYPVAYFLARHVRPNRQLLFLLLLLVPFWVGEIVRTFAIMILLGNRGFLNIALMELGLTEQPIPFMYTTFSLGFGVVYLTALYMLLPLYAALEKIPKNYFEAAADLGAGPIARLRRITLPLSRDGIATGCALVFLISTGYYGTPILLGGPSTTLFAETIGGFFAVAGDQWPVGAAFSSIMFISTLAVAGIFLKLMGGRRGGLLA